MSKKQRFNIYGRVTVETDLEITAADYEDAARQAKELGVMDFVEVKGDLVDNEPAEITGIYKVR